MRLIYLVFMLLVLPTGFASAAVTVEVGENTGLRTWQWSHEGISLRLVQRLPDQTRGYLQGRGFPVEVADEAATSCFFGTMFRNDGTLPLDFDLNTWKVMQKGKETLMLVRERWKTRLQERAVPKAARIALHWSLMPTQQHFEPGDYNWGMMVFGLPPGDEFDLHLQLKLGGKQVAAIIPGLQCPPEKLN
ncbi:hypothetical protein [Thiolapillus sp.]